jgi:iron complex outermembrane receptor protein
MMLRGGRLLPLVLLLGCALGATARAEESEEREALEIEVPVETIEVRGDIDEIPTLDPTVFATVIGSDEFDGRVTSIPDLLRETVGVQIQNLGGEFATVSIRGSTAEQVVVYLDGVPLNQALGGGVNLADLPLAQVESIEIYRGSTPASLPAASIGGAIVIHSRRPTSGPTGSVSASFGSYDSGEVIASFTGSRERFHYSFGIDGAASDGDFTFLDDNGTPQEGSDDSMTLRSNNDFKRLHLSGQGAFSLGRRSRLSLTTDLFRREQGVPGLSANQSETARLDTSRMLARAEVETPGLYGGHLLLRGALDFTRFDEEFDDSAGDLGFAIPRKTENRIDSFGQEFGAVIVASRHQAISFNASRRDETADLKNQLLAQPDLGEANRITSSFTLEDQISLAGDRVILTPSLRHERWDNRFRPGDSTATVPPSLEESDGETLGRIGLRLMLRDGLTLKANYARFLRLPAFTELFGNRGSVLGNPALLPERGRIADIGIEVVRVRPERFVRRTRGGLTLFETLADDLILFVPNSQSTVVALNIGRARIRGAELSLAFLLGDRFSAGLNATHQRAVDDSGGVFDGNQLPGRPRDELSADAGLDLWRGRLFYRFTYVGENFVDKSNTESAALPSRYLHDVGYRIDMPHGLRAIIEVKNVADDQNVDVARFPLPGRSLRVRLTWQF